MKKLLLLLLLLITRVAYADVENPLNFTEEDGAPSTYPYSVKVSNGTLTDNGDGTASINTAGTSSTPGGANTNVQFNDSSAFGGEQSFTWNKTTNTLGISRDVSQGGLAIAISSDTNAVLANISHDGTASFVTLQLNNSLAAIEGGTGQSAFVKGDILAAPDTTSLNRLAVGTNGQVLSADSAATNGVKWATLPAVVAPGGSTNEFQYNNAGAFGGATLVSFDATRSRVAIGPNTSTLVSLDVAGSTRTVPVQLTDGSSIALDASRSDFYYVILTGQPRTLANPTNVPLFKKWVLAVSQDATGSRKMGFGTAYKFGTDVTSFDATVTAGAIDFIGFIYNGTSVDVVSVARGYL